LNAHPHFSRKHLDILNHAWSAGLSTSSTDKFKVIERQLLNKIIAEQKLSLTGIVDPVLAKKLGESSALMPSF
jgi:hypothetical protein